MVKFSRLAGEMNWRTLGSGDPEVTGITEDSRTAGPGCLFVAVPGLKFDGRDFIGQAVPKGVAAVMTVDEEDPRLKEAGSTPLILVSREKLRAAMARAACLIFSRPAEKMTMIGLTGTNGKTTTAYLAETMLVGAGLKPGVMGTITHRWPGTVRTASNTTPEGPCLVGALAEMAEAGVDSAVLEVSSHGLAMGRVAGLNFDAALFTNLSRDHLDFHADFEDYYQAKKLLFTENLKPGYRNAVINIDDEYGRRLAEELNDKALTFGFSPEARVRGSELRLGRDGLSLTITAGDKSWRQTSPLLAEVNAYNLLGTAALGLTLDLEPEVIRETLGRAVGAPGRLERVGQNPDYLVLVDYAHSPDALEKAMKACRDIEPKRLLVVFGCGGDRDKGKRSLMGRLAGQLADLTIITSDNPRTEEPWSILLNVEEGLKGLGLSKYEAGELSADGWNEKSYLMIIDRRAAIREAVNLMEPGDVLLIAGKGHEDYQIIGRNKRHLDDREEALAGLKKAGLAQ